MRKKCEPSVNLINYYEEMEDKKAFMKSIDFKLDRFKSFKIKTRRTYFLFEIQIFFDDAEFPYYTVLAKENVAMDRFRNALSEFCIGKELVEVKFKQKKVCGDCSFHIEDSRGDYLFCGKQGLKSTVSEACDYYRTKDSDIVGFEEKGIYTFLKVLKTLTGKYCNGPDGWSVNLQEVRSRDSEAIDGQCKEESEGNLPAM